jgi:hypothetical protein
MLKNITLSTVTFILLSSNLPSFAAMQHPTLKAGLWLTTSNMTGKPVKIQQCIDEKTKAESEKQGEAYIKTNCSNIKESQSGNVYTTEMSCKVIGGKISQQKNVVTVVSTNEIDSKNTMVMDGKTSVMQTHSKRLGDCVSDSTSVTDSAGNTQSLEALIKQAKASQKKH